MSVFSVIPSPNETDPYHVSIGGVSPGIVDDFGKLSWMVPEGVSQKSVSRVLAGLFWKQVWP